VELYEDHIFRVLLSQQPFRLGYRHVWLCGCKPKECSPEMWQTSPETLCIMHFLYPDFSHSESRMCSKP
jgi:hypothetical protein